MNASDFIGSLIASRKQPSSEFTEAEYSHFDFLLGTNDIIDSWIEIDGLSVGPIKASLTYRFIEQHFNVSLNCIGAIETMAGPLRGDILLRVFCAKSMEILHKYPVQPTRELNIYNDNYNPDYLEEYKLAYGKHREQCIKARDAQKDAVENHPNKDLADEILKSL